LAERLESAEAAPAAERVGILGGTFDPVHIGHLLLAEETRLALKLDRVVFIPTGQPWRKADRRVTAAADRLAMVELAIAGNPAFSVSRIEIERQGPTYTVETLERLRQDWGTQIRLWFILGSDALQDLPNWREAPRIVAQARLAVAARESLSPADLARLVQRVPVLPGRVDFVSLPRVEVSSSELRRRLASGRPARYWLPERVEQYVRDHGLYRDLAADEAGGEDARRRTWVL
jgi:nicotinate-nucleotide adenylyltransferase